jgi:hypothetical protein
MKLASAAAVADRRAARLAAVGVVVFLSGCASTAPVVYHDGPQVSNAQRIERDTESCRRLADNAVGLNDRRSGRLAESAAKGGVIGFAATAAAAMVAGAGDVWQTALAGATGGAAGVTAKTLLDWNQPDEAYRGYVERCLEKRGHHVVGWR